MRLDDIREEIKPDPVKKVEQTYLCVSMLLLLGRRGYSWIGRGCLTLKLLVTQHPLVRLLVKLYRVNHQLESYDPFLENILVVSNLPLLWVNCWHFAYGRGVLRHLSGLSDLGSLLKFDSSNRTFFKIKLSNSSCNSLEPCEP